MPTLCLHSLLSAQLQHAAISRQQVVGGRQQAAVDLWILALGRWAPEACGVLSLRELRVCCAFLCSLGLRGVSLRGDIGCAVAVR